jgi:hypothetical protein
MPEFKNNKTNKGQASIYVCLSFSMFGCFINLLPLELIMFNMSSFRVVLSQAVKAQVSANKYWISAWHQGLVLAARDGNMGALRTLCEVVHATPGMRVMPLVEAVQKAGGKTKDFDGMILVSIEKTEDKQTVFRITKNKEVKDTPIVSELMLEKSRLSGWWDFAKPEKVTPPAQFKSVIDVLKKMGGENVLLTEAEKKMVSEMTAMVVRELGAAVFEAKR